MSPAQSPCFANPCTVASTVAALRQYCYCYYQAYEHHGPVESPWFAKPCTSASIMAALRSSASLVRRVRFSLADWICCCVRAQDFGLAASVSFRSCFMACTEPEILICTFFLDTHIYVNIYFTIHICYIAEYNIFVTEMNLIVLR